MKKIYLLILLFNLYNVVGQHTDLVSTRWFVKNSTINGTTTDFPQDNVLFPFVDLFLFNSSTNLVSSSNLVNDSDCQFGFTGHLTYNNTTSFNFNDFTPIATTDNCGTFITDFKNLYLDFYATEITENFTYTIANLGDRKSLIVTNNVGNQIEYTSKIFEEPPFNGNDWVLTDLEIDTVFYNIPSNEEVNFITANFYGYENQTFSTGVCASLEGLINFDENKFYLYELGGTLNDCGVPENQAFQNLYLGFYANNGSNEFTYEINPIENDPHGNSSLIVTDSFGNRAFYFTGLVGVEDTINTLFNIYPNPTKNILQIENLENINITKIQVYNYLGKLIVTKVNNFNTIDFNNFNSGIYLVKIQTDDGILIKKILKK